MATAASTIDLPEPDERAYKRRIWAWTMYDWANSAFATTILAAVLPVYYSTVAGATLPSEAIATANWSLGLSLSLLITAILSPILGTVSDVMRGKKRFLTIFLGMGVLGTGALVLVGTGDWLLASIVFIVGRIGFGGANIFYDALLPHVAKEEDQDEVSTRGFAMGYLGGGLLLAINAVMIFVLGFEEGARWSFLTVAIWWAVFSIPVLRQVPEPPAAQGDLSAGRTVIGESFRRLRETFRDLRQYRELFKYLVAFLIYNDAIGTIIGVAVIYGAELGFGDIELILALLMVQFVGIPFSLIFGSLPNDKSQRRPLFLAFILFNVVALPLVGILGSRALPEGITGISPPPYETITEDDARFYGQGEYPAPGSTAVLLSGPWETGTIPAAELGLENDLVFTASDDRNAEYAFAFNGQVVEVFYSTGPDRGIWTVEVDGEPLLDDDDAPLVIDAYSETERFGVSQTFSLETPGAYTLTVSNTNDPNEASQDILITLEKVVVQEPTRQNNLPVIIGVIVAIEVLAALFAFTIGARLLAGLANTLNTKRSILLAIAIYTIIAVWGFLLDSTLEFWLLAWMVAIVQGGSQALSRSLYASMSPAAKSGEFFGFYAIMEKFSAIIGPLLFAAAATTFGTSRPAILSLIILFAIGAFLLTRVNVDEGRRVARAEDAELFGDVADAEA